MGEWLQVCRDGCGVVEAVILRGVVPTLLAVGVLTALIAAGRVSPGARLAAYAGFWAGLLACCGYALVILERRRTGALAGWTAPPSLGLVGGFLVGLVGLGFYWALRNSRSVGLPCFIQSFGASASLINYYAVPALRPLTIWLAISVAVGSCFAFVIPRRVINRFQSREIDRALFRRWSYDELGDLRRERSTRRTKRWKTSFGRRRAIYGWIARVVLRRTPGSVTSEGGS